MAFNRRIGMRYNVVFEYTSGMLKGFRRWGSYPSEEKYRGTYVTNPGEKVFREGVTREKAVNMCQRRLDAMLRVLTRSTVIGFANTVPDLEAIANDPKTSKEDREQVRRIINYMSSFLDDYRPEIS